MRLSALLALAALLLAACAGPAPLGTADAGGGAADSDLPTCEDGFFWAAPIACVTPASVELAEIFPGGPPPDGIPPIDDPVHESIAAASEWLEPQSPVLSVEVGGEARAYPLAILTWHEIVNDVVGGVPVTVTYCPLCNSGLAFERTVDGEVLDFGTSGRLWRSNLVMYDRQTRTLWSQFTGEGIVGPAHLGRVLQRVPTSVLGWSEFVAAADPSSLVLSRDTGHTRDYGRNPYAGYDDAGGSPFLFNGSRDDRLPDLERVVGLGDDGDPLALHRAWVERAGVVAVEVAGTPLVVAHVPGATSALDRASIDASRDVGSIVVFEATVDGAVRTFRREGNRLVDDTGTAWDVLGRAVAGPDAGAQLTPVAHDDTFWFVWFVFRPDTRLVGADGPIG